MNIFKWNVVLRYHPRIRMPIASLKLVPIKYLSAELQYVPWTWKNSDDFGFCSLIHHISIFWNIYTPNVFCYDEYKKNFDIHFSMKKHTWRMSRLLRRQFLIPPCYVFKNGLFHSQNGTILIKYQYKAWILLVCFSWRYERQRIHV